MLFGVAQALGVHAGFTDPPVAYVLRSDEEADALAEPLTADLAQAPGEGQMSLVLVDATECDVANVCEGDPGHDQAAAQWAVDAPNGNRWDGGHSDSQMSVADDAP
ncbi:hypothetical protein [Streptomyces malaysiensis]|uniref:hypothetical protein n=1 Tax=Streptomyces malaysiensis TaxID=92644 RepID=UPI003716B985